MANPFQRIKNYWFPTASNPLSGDGEGISRTEDPKHLDKYIARVQLQRIRQDVQSWREAVTEAELAYYPHRVQMQRLFNDTALNGHVYACMEKRKHLTLQKNIVLLDESDNINEQWTKYFNDGCFKQLMNYALDSIFFGYNLINFSEIDNNKLKGLQVIKRHNISPDRLQVVSYVYALSGIQFQDNEDYKDWVFWCPTYSENGISTCGYGLLYRVAIYEIMLRNLLGYNGDFVELYSQPIRVAKTMKTSEEERGELENMMRNLGSSGWAIFDPTDEIELLESKGSSNGWQGYENLEQRCEKKISKILLGHADAMDSTQGKLGESHEIEDALSVIEKNDVSFICNFFNDEVIPKLRNHGIDIPGNLIFGFANDKEKSEGLEKTSEVNAKFLANIDLLAKNGYKVTAEYIEKVTGYPVEKSEENEPIEGQIQNKLKELYGI